MWNRTWISCHIKTQGHVFGCQYRYTCLPQNSRCVQQLFTACSHPLLETPFPGEPEVHCSKIWFTLFPFWEDRQEKPTSKTGKYGNDYKHMNRSFFQIFELLKTCFIACVEKINCLRNTPPKKWWVLRSLYYYFPYHGYYYY